LRQGSRERAGVRTGSVRRSQEGIKSEAGHDTFDVLVDEGVDGGGKGREGSERGRRKTQATQTDGKRKMQELVGTERLQAKGTNEDVVEGRLYLIAETRRLEGSGRPEKEGEEGCESVPQKEEGALLGRGPLSDPEPVQIFDVLPPLLLLPLLPFHHLFYVVHHVYYSISVLLQKCLNILLRPDRYS